jgi:hypothetical protein
MMMALLLVGVSLAAASRRLTDQRSAKFFASVKQFEIASVRRTHRSQDIKQFHTRLLQSSSVPVHERQPSFEIAGFNRTFALDLRLNEKLFHPGA